MKIRDERTGEDLVGDTGDSDIVEIDSNEFRTWITLRAGYAIMFDPDEVADLVARVYLNAPS